MTDTAELDAAIDRASNKCRFLLDDPLVDAVVVVTHEGESVVGTIDIPENDDEYYDALEGDLDDVIDGRITPNDFICAFPEGLISKYKEATKEEEKLSLLNHAVDAILYTHIKHEGKESVKFLLDGLSETVLLYIETSNKQLQMGVVSIEKNRACH